MGGIVSRNVATNSKSEVSATLSWSCLLWAIKHILREAPRNKFGAQRPKKLSGVYRFPLFYESLPEVVVFLHYRMRELYFTDCHNPGICRSGPSCAHAWDVSRCKPSRIALGTTMVLVCSKCSRILFFSVFFLRAHKTYIPHVSSSVASCISMILPPLVPTMKLWGPLVLAHNRGDDVLSLFLFSL